MHKILPYGYKEIQLLSILDIIANTDVQVNSIILITSPSMIC